MITAENMVRVGIVSDFNQTDWTARVSFPDAGNMVSGWLYVLWHKREVEEAEGHTHNLTWWTPEVGDKVLCLLQYGEETDGYVLGAIGS